MSGMAQKTVKSEFRPGFRLPAALWGAAKRALQGGRTATSGRKPQMWKGLRSLRTLGVLWAFPGVYRLVAPGRIERVGQRKFRRGRAWQGGQQVRPSRWKLLDVRQ